MATTWFALLRRWARRRYFVIGVPPLVVGADQRAMAVLMPPVVPEDPARMIGAPGRLSTGLGVAVGVAVGVPGAGIGGSRSSDGAVAQPLEVRRHWPTLP